MSCGNSARGLRGFLWWSLALATSAFAAEPQSLTLERFGEVSIYRSSVEPRELVLFVSGKKIGCRSMKLRSIESRPRRLALSIDERSPHTANCASIFCATSRIFGRNCSTAVRSGTAEAA